MVPVGERGSRFKVFTHEPMVYTAAHAEKREREGLIVYQVRVLVDREIEESWYAWMVGTHIPDVLASGFFTRAHIARILEPSPPSNREGYLIQYECESRERFQRYQAEAAPALQRDHGERFPNRFEASRTVFEIRRGFRV